MQAIDRLKSEIDDWARRSGSSPGNKEFDSLRSTLARSIPHIPQDTLTALFTTFLSRCGSDSTDDAIDWLCGVGSLLLSDYDGTVFSKAEWEEIRELVTIDSGEVDVETLTYVLGQALEHGAL